MSEEEEYNSEEYIYYSTRPEWKDVQPLPQDDGPNPVVRIAYTEKFKDVYGYMRAVLRSGEKSQRVLDLTTDAIDCNPANYTVWHYRRQVLQAINADLNEEMIFIADVILSEPKNYQVWYHRQKLVEWTEDPAKELSLTAEVLEEDGKNYHSWQHRQWIVQRYGLWDGELDFTDEMIKKDLRNNSAWNQRYFIVSNTTGFTDDVIEKELQYVIPLVRKAPNNESTWNYLHGVLKDKRLSEQPLVRTLCDYLYNQHVPSSHLLSTMVEIYEEEAEKGNNESLQSALELCHKLATKVDPIRQQYWEYTSRRLTITYGAESKGSGEDKTNPDS